MRGNALGESLDQVQRIARDEFGDLLSELAVVSGLRKVIALSCRSQVKVKHHIDDERLAIASFVFKNPVMADGGDPRQGDSVLLRGETVCHDPPTWSRLRRL